MDNEYKIVDGTYYDAQTDENVVRVLEQVRASQNRIRIFYGDVKTGRSWLDEFNMIGTIGRSMGPQKIPILVANTRSMGGGAILDHCIIRIDVRYGKGRASHVRTEYKHPKFHYGLRIMKRGEPLESNGKVYNWIVWSRKGVDENIYANTETEEKAKRLVAFLSGESWRK